MKKGTLILTTMLRKKQLSRNMAIKDPIINRQVNKKVDDYRISVSGLGEKLEFFTAETLRDYLSNNNSKIDFIKFCDDHIRQLRKDDRGGTAANHTTVGNSLVDYFKSQMVLMLEITVSMLKSYERFLRSKRTMTRMNQFDREVTTEGAGLTDSGLYNYMRDLRTLFNAAREKYNDEDLGIRPRSIACIFGLYHRYRVAEPQ